MKEIVQEGQVILREKAVPVPEDVFGSPELARLVADMAEALDAEPDGVALAAPQLGSHYRLFIVRKDRTLPSLPTKDGESPPARTAEIEVYINPEIIRRSRKKQVVDEGCLSVRGMYGATKRAERATVRAQREDGTTFERGAGGILAQIFEHEVDHLNGILFIDHAENLIELKKETPDE